MNTYTPENQPKSGTARKIWAALEDFGFCVTELHYNPNCWKNSRESGWGSWVCYVTHPQYGTDAHPLFCGYDKKLNQVWIQQWVAPYRKTLLTNTSKGE